MINTAKTFTLLAALGGLIVAGGVLGGSGGLVIRQSSALSWSVVPTGLATSPTIASAKAVPVTREQMPEHEIMEDLTARADMPLRACTRPTRRERSRRAATPTMPPLPSPKAC